MLYTEENRGAIQNRERAKQIIDFSGLRLDCNITPTDIDGLIEYHNRAWVIKEFKLRDASLPFGQKLALSRLIDDLSSNGKPAICIIGEHIMDNPNDDIKADEYLVRSIYYQHTWRDYKAKNIFRTVREVVDNFIAYANKKEELDSTLNSVTYEQLKLF